MTFMRIPYLKLTTMGTLRNCSNITQIFVKPTSSLVDEQLAISVTGLEPETNVTIRALMEERKMSFESHANYIADCYGQVKVTEQPSVGGSYVGIEPMGLFWSMLQSPGQKKGPRFVKLDISTPITVNLAVYKGFFNSKSLQNTNPMLNIEIKRWYKAGNVERIPVRCGKVRGVILKPKGKGPFPGIIDIFGNTGGLIEFRAALFASKGFASFALPYFAYDDLPSSYYNMDFEYFEEACDWFSSQPYINSGGIGVIGVSTGGQIALAMGAYYSDIVKAVVSISSHCGHPPFRYRGEDLPAFRLDVSKCVEGEHGLIGYPGVGDVQKAPEKNIPVEKARNLLFVVGEADLVCPSLVNVRELIKRLEANNHVNYELRSYPGAGHLIEPPYSPFCRSSLYKTKQFGTFLLDWGGNMVEHARAREDSWLRVIQFFRRHLGKT